MGYGFVLFVRVARRARGLERSVDAVDRLADDLQAVDRIGGGGSVEFHAFVSFASARPAAMARSTNVTLKALPLGGLRAGEQPRRDRLGSLREFGFGRLHPPWLVRHATERHAATAIGLHDHG